MNTSEIENKLRPGDVILTCAIGINPFSLFIKIANFFKRGPNNRKWTHAAFYIGNGKVIEAFPRGIVKRDFKESYLNGEYELLILRSKNASEERLKKAIDFCCNEEGSKYDFRGLIYFLLFNLIPNQIHFLLDNDFIGDCFNVNDAYFCSELVSTGFKEAGIYCFEREPYKVMPVDFYNDLLFNLIDKIEVKKKENPFLIIIKKLLIYTLYLITAIVFLFVAILLGLLIIALFAWFIGLVKLFFKKRK